MGQVLLEALLVGTPVIATSRGAIPEVIINNFNGRLVPYNKPEKFAQMFLKLPKSKFKKNGRKILKSKFNEEKMFIKTMEVYKESTR